MKILLACIIGITILLVMGFTSVSQSSEKDKRTRVIDFEEQVIEGLNRRPLDSMTQIVEKRLKGVHAHLYRKRIGFKNEVQETLSELRYQP
jgi:hypothetical protein